MAKYIVDEATLLAIVQKWHSPKEIVNDMIQKSEKLIYCENCDSSSAVIAPFLQKHFVHCDYYRTDMPRCHFCSNGEEK